MPIEMKVYSSATLHTFGVAVLEAMGAPRDEAMLVSDALLHGALHGHPGQGQGYNKLPRFWREIRGGAYRPGSPLESVAAGATWVLLEGHNGLGPVVAAKAMDRAIALASEHGVGQVWVRGSNHLSSCGFHALRAVEAGFIGICVTNAGPELAPWGGTTPVLGTNPWAIAVPTRGEFPLLLDIALTQSGKGMIRWFQREGRPIPRNWAYAPDGRETDDAALALQGPLVPIGEFKGVGLSFMTDILIGVLIGAGYGVHTYADPTRRNVGHFLMAVDPERFVGRDAFYDRLDDLMHQVWSTRRRPGVDAVYVPGELEYRRAQERQRNGIPVDVAVVEELRDLAKELRVECPL